MASSGQQRNYRAPCPGCGAPIEFKSAQSTHTVCGYCQSTVVRQGEVLARLGKMAELFDDHSLLQLGASGRYQQKPFTLIGRLQFRSDSGTWTEWEALFDSGELAQLSEDNGSYVFSRAILSQRPIPAAKHFPVGGVTAINGKTYTVASRDEVKLVSAQGELPKLPALGEAFTAVELRNDGGEVIGIEYRSEPPALSLGRTITLDELAMTGLKEESAREERGRQFNCPHCGSPVTVQLEGSKSITCGSCHSLIDLTSGIGGELHHATQSEPVQPLIRLGTVGQLQGVHWQVVGFQHRVGQDPQDSDEQFGWEEYLLYNAKRGFCFLVDSSEGWSLVKPVTGAPKLSSSGQEARYLGSTYTLKYRYRAETTYVLGEFYWQVHRGQFTQNQDFAMGRELLSKEESKTEITWSAGSLLASDTVAKAFGMESQKDLLKRSDAGPVSGGMGCLAWIVILAVLLIVLLLLTRCNRDCDPRVENCSSSSSSSRTSGGSYGGYSSGGGGHK